jgi:hypothetical protein
VEPTCVTQALQHVEWKQAMSDEITVLMKNGTWSLVSHDSIIMLTYEARIWTQTQDTIRRHR